MVLKGTMWGLVLTISLFFWTSEAVTCKNNNNGDVDWYILYSEPNGYRYFYIDSDNKKGTLNDIRSDKGFLANTLQPILKKKKDMPKSFGFISYSDQPPPTSTKTVTGHPHPKPTKKTAGASCGHSKGVVMVDKDEKQGIWLLHSKPQFPFDRDQNNFWKKGGNIKAQTFICVTFPYDQFKKIGEHLQSIRAYPFDHHNTENLHVELKNAADKKKISVIKDDQELKSKGGQTFKSFAKQQKNSAKDGDLYVKIAQTVKSKLRVQTWGCQKGRDGPYCTGSYEVLNINYEPTKASLGEWSFKVDHSKWCVAETNNWVCIADVNRAESQYKRPGGALCIEHKDIKDFFFNFAKKTDDCSSHKVKRTSMDIESEINDCEFDPETDCDCDCEYNCGPEIDCDSESDFDSDSDSDSGSPERKKPRGDARKGQENKKEQVRERSRSRGRKP